MKNIAASLEEIRNMISSCKVCAENKPRFVKSQDKKLVKANQPLERLSLDFKGPVPSTTCNKYFLAVVDEYSKFPFAILCSDVSTSTVIRNLSSVFSIFGTPGYIHYDRGASFMSNKLKTWLHSKNIPTSRTTPYNPAGNGQFERYNATIWKAITLTCKSRGFDIKCWESVLPDAMHSIRSLLCTATNKTPHELLFSFAHRSTSGESMPYWLKPGPVYLKRHVRRSNYDQLVDEVELIVANPNYAHIRHNDGRESTVSLRYFAPCAPTKTPTCQPLRQPLPQLLPQPTTSPGLDPLDQINTGIQSNQNNIVIPQPV